MSKQPDLVTNLPPGVAERLGHYVYLYLDPRTGTPFYVGKGRGERVLAHFDDAHDSRKTQTIASIRAAGLVPLLEILAHGLKDEETAFRVEAAAIDLLRLGELTNEVRGWKSLQVGRMTLDQLIGYYAAPPVEVKHSALLIRINKLYRHTMSPLELYEATRGIWKLGERRQRAQYAFAVFEGVVREVFEVQSWHPGGTTPYKTRDFSKRNVQGRWEFQGKIAPTEIREQYRNRSVRDYFRQGNRSPAVYVTE